MNPARLARSARFSAYCCIFMAVFGCVSWVCFIRLYISFSHGLWHYWFKSPYIYQQYMNSFAAAVYGIYPSLIVLFTLLGRLLLRCSRCIMGLNER